MERCMFTSFFVPKSKFISTQFLRSDGKTGQPEGRMRNWIGIGGKIRMARIKGGVNAKKKHNRVLKLAKGYRGARSKQYRVAKQAVMRALASSYAGRKERKRQFRQLWIARINAAARINGLSYSRFMYGLKLAGVDINRKMLAEMAVNDAEGFKSLAELAKSKVA